jgi:hypothetical protein
VGVAIGDLRHPGPPPPSDARHGRPAWPTPAGLGCCRNGGAIVGASVVPTGEGNGGRELEQRAAAAGGEGGCGGGESWEWAEEMAGEKIRPSGERGGGHGGGG